MHYKTKHQIAVFAIIASSIIWGAAPPILKWSMESIAPFTLASFRFIIASLVILPFLWRRDHGHLFIHKEDVKKFILLGLFGVSLHIGFFLYGLTIASSINAPIIGALTPIFLLLIAVFILKERVKKKIIYGTAISMLGIGLIVMQPILEKGFDKSFLGNLCYILGTIAFVPYTVMLKEVVKKYDYLVVLFWTFLIGSITFLPMAYLEFQSGMVLTYLNGQAMFGILYGSVFASVLAYLFYMYGIKNLVTNEVGIFLYINPIVTVIVAIPLLGEAITPIFLVGSILVFLGIYVSESHEHHLHHHLHKFK